MADEFETAGLSRRELLKRAGSAPAGSVDRLMTFYDFDEIERAAHDASRGGQSWPS